MTDIDFARIELLVLDVDGVMTDGRIVYGSGGQELKFFHVRDGSGMKYWRRAGGKLAIISGRGGEAVERRADELGVQFVRQKLKDKLPAYDEALAELGFEDGQVAAIGDDLTDLPIHRRVGMSIAVADAAEELRAQADYVTRLPGGRGCVREAIELILKKSGRWDRIMARYRPRGRTE